MTAQPVAGLVGQLALMTPVAQHAAQLVPRLARAAPAAKQPVAEQHVAQRAVRLVVRHVAPPALQLAHQPAAAAQPVQEPAVVQRAGQLVTVKQRVPARVNGRATATVILAARLAVAGPVMCPQHSV